MCIWGADAIYIRNNPSPNHSFNKTMVGRGRWHSNVLQSSEKIEVKLWVAAFLAKDPMQSPLIKAEIRGQFCLDTGSSVSVFRVELARELGLDIGNPFERPLTLADGTACTRWWCEHQLAVYVGPGECHKKGVRVWFPIKRCSPDVNLTGWDWDDNYQGDNLLGTRDVLSRWMFCFTPEGVFVFARREQ